MFVLFACARVCLRANCSGVRRQRSHGFRRISISLSLVKTGHQCETMLLPLWHQVVNQANTIICICWEFHFSPVATKRHGCCSHA